MQSFLSKSQEDPVLREILAGRFPPKKFDYLQLWVDAFVIMVGAWIFLAIGRVILKMALAFLL